MDALAELEDHECHRARKFPKTRLHRVFGYKQAVYRADIDKISGWRIHLQYEGGQVHLKDVIPCSTSSMARNTMTCSAKSKPEKSGTCAEIRMARSSLPSPYPANHALSAASRLPAGI